MISYQFISLLLFTSCFIFISIDAQRQPGQCCEEYCYDKDTEKPQSSWLATKTAYQIIKRSESKDQFVVPSSLSVEIRLLLKFILFQDCNPVKFWFVSRHGTRLPDNNTITSFQELVDLRDEVIDNYEKRGTKPDYGALCDEDIEILKNWRCNPNITHAYAQFLMTQGWRELHDSAKNYQSIFPNLLENIYTPEKYLFRHTYIQSSEASYGTFVEGLFGEGASEHIQTPPKTEPDLLLLPFVACKSYWSTLAKQISPDSEMSKFENTDTYKQTIHEISARLGFKFLLTSKQIITIWDMCRYDLSFDLELTSPWCVAFTPNNIKVLEYHEDLQYYYQNGYGTVLNTRMACSLVVDMLNHLESERNPKVVAYFGHSVTMQIILTALGSHKDIVDVRADNYQENLRRKWRTSEVCPLASNLAVIKYECPHDNERNKIMFSLNEKPLDLDWCNDGLCGWSKVQQMYSSFKQQDCLTTYCSE